MEFQINTASVFMIEYTSHKKYILLRQGNILNLYFGEGKSTLKGFENKT